MRPERLAHQEHKEQKAEGIAHVSAIPECAFWTVRHLVGVELSMRDADWE